MVEFSNGNRVKLKVNFTDVAGKSGNPGDAGIINGVVTSSNVGGYHCY
jgi:hypothetical protein